jgi:DUF1365 family protein
MKSCLYVGHLMHARRDEHAQRAFRYPLYAACIDLSELDELHATLRLFSHNRANLFSLHDRDYATPLARGRLITQLRVAGYVFNPVSFFLHDDGSAIAEVNNNYGGRHAYALAPGQTTVEKSFFVSPFLHGPASYDFRFDAPRDAPRMSIGMRVTRPGERHAIFVARLEGRRVPLTDRTLAITAVRYPLMTLQVIGLIYWEALRMHVAGVPFRRPTDPPLSPARTERAAR